MSFLKNTYTASVTGFLIKGGAAVYINYEIASNASFEQYSFLAVIMSVGMLLSIADFGIGQYLVTIYCNAKLSHKIKALNFINAQLIIAGISCVTFLVASCYVLTEELVVPVFHSMLLVSLIVARVVFVPHGAYLQSLGRYHERKIIEGAFYFISAVYTCNAIKVNTSFNEIVLMLNVLITLSSIVTFARARQLSCPAFNLAEIDRSYCAMIFRKSFPYFLNNSAGLLVYGGFVFVSAILVSVTDLAKIALLHTMLFTNIYQAFDLVFRTSLTRINEVKIYRALNALLVLGFIVFVLSWFLLGSYVVDKVFPGYLYESSDLYVYALYVFSESAYLLRNTRLQMAIEMRRILMMLSIIKACSFLFLVFVTSIWSPIAMRYYLLLLLFWSVFNFFLIARSELFPKLKFMRGE